MTAVPENRDHFKNWIEEIAHIITKLTETFDNFRKFAQWNFLDFNRGEFVKGKT